MVKVTIVLMYVNYFISFKVLILVVCYKNAHQSCTGVKEVLYSTIFPLYKNCKIGKSLGTWCKRIQ